MSNFIENIMAYHAFPSALIADNSDFTAGDPASDIMSLANYHTCTFVYIKGAGGTGQATLTVESCDTVAPGTATAVAFRYRKITSPNTSGAVTAATSTGFTTAASADLIYLITIDDTELSGSDSFVRLQVTETESTAQDGAIMALLSNPRFADPTPVTANA